MTQRATRSVSHGRFRGTEYPGFDRFWAVYPVHHDKRIALEIWQKLHCEDLTDVIVAKVELLKRDDSRWRRGYVKDPHRWLKAGGWDDDPIRDPNAEPPTKWREVTSCPHCRIGFWKDEGHQCAAVH